MFKKQIRIAALFLITIGFSLSVMAWGMLGHRIVGQIADSYLSRQARKEIRFILGNESIAMSSNYADFVKSDPKYNYLYNWHFVNLMPGLDSGSLHKFLDSDTAVDAYTKINFLATQLKDKGLHFETRSLYLKMLIHIVGDVHQPLHTGRLKDRGGNDIKVLWFRDTVNLHQVWDDKLLNFQQLSYTEYAAAINFAGKDWIRELQAEPVNLWIWNSYQQAEKIYAGIKQPYQSLEYKYNYQYLSTLNDQLLKGGIHLAGLLNEIFR
ncbi:MAG: S1/P1 nuclease [Chitinophagaceae bacterium]|nr:S1/P1 nuclease [Chitinophagaceae bacterium]